MSPVKTTIIGETKQMNVKEKQHDSPNQKISDYESDLSEDSESNKDKGLNESKYKRMRIEKKLQQSFTVPEALLNQAQLLKNPRSGIFVYQCKQCLESQKQRQYFLFSTGISGLSILTIELCEEDLEKNISLGMHYSGYFGHYTNKLQKDTHSSNVDVLKFSRGGSIITSNAKKLLKLTKFCWVLHQVLRKQYASYNFSVHNAAISQKRWLLIISFRNLTTNIS
uniref:Uncharacterized protein n=1 Tax=Meloidogyne enterolobii TaxID=390850 RepID=A0A6V7Y1R9_MELEN|nr:unnamed protein product [Meloidogyne enterolobii]